MSKVLAKANDDDEWYVVEDTNDYPKTIGVLQGRGCVAAYLALQDFLAEEKEQMRRFLEVPTRHASGQVWEIGDSGIFITCVDEPSSEITE